MPCRHYLVLVMVLNCIIFCLSKASRVRKNDKFFSANSSFLGLQHIGKSLFIIDSAKRSAIILHLLFQWSYATNRKIKSSNKISYRCNVMKRKLSQYIIFFCLSPLTDFRSINGNVNTKRFKTGSAEEF